MTAPIFQEVRLLTDTSSKSKEIPVKMEKGSPVVFWKDIEKMFKGISLSLYMSVDVRFERGDDKKLLEPLRIKYRLDAIIVQEESSLGTSIHDIIGTIEKCHKLQMEEHRRSQQLLDNVLEQTNNIFRGIFELQEYTIPRLFIILPQKVSKVSKLDPSTIGTKTFRLYFLCECGETTPSAVGNVSHKMHFAKHEGYELKKPKKFMRKYGPHIIRLLKVIQHLSSIASGAIPLILSLTELSNEVRKSLDVTEDGILPLVDITSRHIAEQLQSLNDGLAAELQSHSLAGAELRSLDTFLTRKDDERALGNLNRIMTPKGGVRWVCKEHYHETVSEREIADFSRRIMRFNGTYDLTQGMKVDLKPETIEEIYKILSEVTFVQKLTIIFDWEPSSKDLKNLRDAIKSSNIVSLTVHCISAGQGSFIRSAGNAVGRFSKHPLVQLMKAVDRPPVGMLRSLIIHGLRDVLQESNYIPENNRLDCLGMDRMAFAWKDKEKLFRLLLNAPHLTHLILSYSTLDMARKMTEELYSKAPQLITVEFDNEFHERVVFHLDCGKIATVDVKLERDLTHGYAELTPIASWGDMENLTVGYKVEQDKHGQILLEIVSNCKRLVHLEIKCSVEDFCPIFRLLQDATKDQPAFKTVHFRDGKNELSTKDIWNSFETTTLKLKNESSLGFESFWLFGWVPTKVEPTASFTDDQMVILSQHIESDKTPSRLQELDLDISELKHKGLSRLETILKRLSLTVLKLAGSQDYSSKLLDLIKTYGATVTGFDITIRLDHHSLIPSTFQTIKKAIGHVKEAKLYLSSPAIDVHLTDLQGQLTAPPEILREQEEFGFEFVQLFGCFPPRLECNPDDDDIQTLEKMTAMSPDRLQSLSVNIDRLSEQGLENLATVVIRSTSLVELKVDATNHRGSRIRSQEMNSFISTISSQITKLRLSYLKFDGDNLPPNFDLPSLQIFELINDPDETSSACAEWIRYISSSCCLKELVLVDVKLEPDLWELVIGGVNFQNLESVIFDFSSLRVEHLQSIVDRIPQGAPLKHIFTGGWDLKVNMEERDRYKNQIKEKIPDCVVRHKWYLP